MNCNTTHYRANSSSVPGDPTLAAQTFASSDVATDLSASTASTHPTPPGPRALLRAWRAHGALAPASGEPAPLVQRALALYREGAGSLARRGLAALVVLAFLALPGGLLLAWRPARDVFSLWIPGAALVRRGAPLRGYAVLGLTVFALLPLAWLSVARSQGALPAPGPVTANLFASADLALTLVPVAPPVHGQAWDLTDPEARAEAFERLCASHYARLLAVYPGAGPFWFLVFAALATVVGVESWTLRRAWLGQRARTPLR